MLNMMRVLQDEACDRKFTRMIARVVEGNEFCEKTFKKAGFDIVDRRVNRADGRMRVVYHKAAPFRPIEINLAASPAEYIPAK